MKINEVLVEIFSEKLDVPFHKTYALDLIKNDINEADFTVAAELEENIAGFATVRFEEWNKRAVMTRIFVTPEYKGRGIGREFVDATLNYAKSKQACCL